MLWNCILFADVQVKLTVSSDRIYFQPICSLCIFTLALKWSVSKELPSREP